MAQGCFRVPLGEDFCAHRNRGGVHRSPKNLNLLAGAAALTLAMPDTQQRLSEQGIDVTQSSPEEFAKFIKSEVAKWAKMVKESGISAD